MPAIYDDWFIAPPNAVYSFASAEIRNHGYCQLAYVNGCVVAVLTKSGTHMKEGAGELISILPSGGFDDD
jgi:hypothetical protein